MKTEREQPRDIMLEICRLTYMLIDELVENEEQRERFFKLVDKATEELHEDREKKV